MPLLNLKKFKFEYFRRGSITYNLKKYYYSSINHSFGAYILGKVRMFTTKIF